MTILMVEQNARRALAMSDRGYVLDLGANRFEGKGKDLIADPKVAELYLGGGTRRSRSRQPLRRRSAASPPATRRWSRRWLAGLDRRIAPRSAAAMRLDNRGGRLQAATLSAAKGRRTHAAEGPRSSGCVSRSGYSLELCST